MANLHFPFIVEVCNEAVDMFELSDDRLWDWDFDFVRPEHGCHVARDHGIDAMVEVFRKFCFVLFCFALAADVPSDLVELLLDCSAESILEAGKVFFLVGWRATRRRVYHARLLLLKWSSCLFGSTLRAFVGVRFVCRLGVYRRVFRC